MIMRAAEVSFHLVAGKMHSRRDNVAWMLAPQLNDIFAKVGLHRLNAIGFKKVIEFDLFGDHRLALGGATRTNRTADVENNLAGIRGSLGPVHVAAAFRHL